MNDYQKLYYSNQEDFLAYKHYKAKNPKNFGILFLGGFKADMEGTKATHLANWAEEKDFDFISFDYSGHGKSSKKINECTLGDWLNDCTRIFDQLINKKQIIIGSSMGGWLMILLALIRKDKIAGLIGLASAPDFIEDLIWKELSPLERKKIEEDEILIVGDGYEISKRFIYEARNHLILHNEIDLNMPISLIHGLKDDVVPYQTSITLAQKLTSKLVEILLVKDSDHRLSSQNDLALITSCILRMVKKI